MGKPPESTAMVQTKEYKLYQIQVRRRKKRTNEVLLVSTKQSTANSLSHPTEGVQTLV